MSHLIANLEGKGHLTAGEASGIVDYDIAIMSDGLVKSASGTIEAGIDLLMSGFNAGKAKLRLQDGGVISVILTGVDTGTGSADIQVSGAVPGY